MVFCDQDGLGGCGRNTFSMIKGRFGEPTYWVTSTHSLALTLVVVLRVTYFQKQSHLKLEFIPIASFSCWTDNPFFTWIMPFFFSSQ